MTKMTSVQLAAADPHLALTDAQRSGDNDAIEAAQKAVQSATRDLYEAQVKQ